MKVAHVPVVYHVPAADDTAVGLAAGGHHQVAFAGEGGAGGAGASGSGWRRGCG